MEEEGIDPFSVNRNPQIIKAAQEQIATMDVLVCGVCHSVFHFIEEFQDHKSKNECGAPAFKGNLTETKPQVWAFLLWKSSRAKSELGEGADQVSSWKLYQKWCKMPENIRDSWVCAGKAIQVSTTLATAKMQEVKTLGKVQMINKIKGNDTKDSLGTDIKKEGVVRKMTNIRGKPGRPPQGQDDKPSAEGTEDKNKDGNISIENGSSDTALLSDTVEIKEEQVSEADVEDHAIFEDEDEEEENRRTRLELGESIEDIDKSISRQVAVKAGDKKGLGESDDSSNVVRRKGKDGEKGNSESEDEYVVERIVSRRYNIRKKAYEYLLKWEGYPDDQNTWEPEENLADCKHLLENFERNLAKQKAQQQQRSGSGYPGGPKMITAAPDRRGSPKSVGRPVRSSKKKALDQVKAWCGSMYTKKPDEDGGQGSSEGSEDEDGVRKGKSLSESEDASQHADGNLSSDDLIGRKRKKEDDDYRKGPGRPRKVIKVNGMPSASGKTIVASSNQELAKAIGEFITGFDGGTTDKKTPIVLGKKETGGNITLTATQQPVLVANSKGVVKVDPRAMPNLASGVYIMSKSSPGAPNTGLIKVDSPVVTSAATPNVKVVSGPGQKQGGILAMKDAKSNTTNTSPPLGSSPPKTILGPKKPTVLGAAPSAVTPMKLLPKLVSPQIRGGGLVRMPQTPRPVLSSPSPRPLVAPGAKLPLTLRPSLVSPQASVSAGKGIRPLKPKQSISVTGTKVSTLPLSSGMKSGIRPIEAMLGGTTPTAATPSRTILGKKGTPTGSAGVKDSTESAEGSKTSRMESAGATPLRGTPANRGRAKGVRAVAEGKSSENKKFVTDDSVAMELTEERNSDTESESDCGLPDDFPTGDLPPIEPASPPRPLTLCPLTGKILARAEGEKTPPPSPPPAAPTTPLSEAILPDDGDGEGEETLIKVEMSPGGTTGTVVSEGGALLRTEAGLTVKRLLAGGAQGNASNLLSTMTQLSGQVQGIALPARKLFTEDGTEIVESDTEMLTIQGEDGVVYQVQGELEEGAQTLLVQGEDGEQRCVYVTTNEGVEGEDGETVLTFGDPAYADAVAQLDPSQVEALSEGGSQILLQGEDGTTFSETQLMSVMEGDKEDGEAQIVAQVLEAGQPQPGGGPRKVVLLLPDGNMMMTEVDEEQYAALELDK